MKVACLLLNGLVHGAVFENLIKQKNPKIES